MGRSSRSTITDSSGPGRRIRTAREMAPSSVTTRTDSCGQGAYKVQGHGPFEKYYIDERCSKKGSLKDGEKTASLRSITPADSCTNARSRKERGDGPEDYFKDGQLKWKGRFRTVKKKGPTRRTTTMDSCIIRAHSRMAKKGVVRTLLREWTVATEVRA